MKYNRIKVVLAERDVSVQQLADKMGRSRPVVSNYVNNYTQPSVQLLFKIAKVPDVPVCDLLVKDR